MDFRIECNLLSHGRIGVGVNVDVANALVMLDHGNPRTLRHGSNQVSPPRGMHRSTYSVRDNKSGMAARSVVGTT